MRSCDGNGMSRYRAVQSWRTSRSCSESPLQNQPLVLPLGRVVRIYNLSFLTQGNDPTPVLRIEPSFRIECATAIGLGREMERSEEAEEVIAYFLGEPAAEHTTVAYADICSTPAQAERRERRRRAFVSVEATTRPGDLPTTIEISTIRLTNAEAAKGAIDDARFASILM